MSITKAQTAFCVAASIGAAALTAQLAVQNEDGPGAYPQLVVDGITSYLYGLVVAGTLRFINERLNPSGTSLTGRVALFLSSSIVGVLAGKELLSLTGPIKQMNCQLTEEISEKGLGAIRAFCGCVTAFEKIGNKPFCQVSISNGFLAGVQAVGHATLGGLQSLFSWRNARQQQRPSGEAASAEEGEELLPAHQIRSNSSSSIQSPV
jgi:hypothetical protein